MRQSIPFLTLLFGGLSLIPGMAHLLEMPHKMQLTQESYATVQYIYQGWAFLGLIQLGAILFTFIFLRQVRNDKGAFRLTLAAFICLLLNLVVFFSITYPVNRITDNWQTVPVDWLSLREQWEYSHAAGAILSLAAFILLIWAALGAATAKVRHPEN